ncbi:PEP-CTERM sorting domain-containing protein [Sulfitobacter sp. LCG007]
MKTKIVTCLTVLAFASGLAVADADAATLAPGDTILMNGSTAASHPELGGVVQQDQMLVTNEQQVPPEAAPFFNFADFNVQNRVVRSDADGTMIFAPRIMFSRNVTPYPLLVNRVDIWGFGDFEIDATYRTDGLGDRGPTNGSRSAGGDMLSFDFGFPLFINNSFVGPQEESYFFSLKTDATKFENTGRLSIFATALGDPVPGREYRFDVGGLAVPTAVAVVPVPASLPLLAIALCWMGLCRRRA